MSGADTRTEPPLIDDVKQLACEFRLGGLLKKYRSAA